MPFTSVATVSATPGANGGTTAAIDTSGANLIVISVGFYSAGTGLTVSDSKGNTWIPLTLRPTSSGNQRFFYAKAASVGTGHTFTVSGTSIYPSIQVRAFAGAATNPFDAESGATNSGSSLATGSTTPSQPGALVVSALCTDSSATVSVAPTMTVTQNPFGSGVAFGGALGYVVQTTAAAINPTWTIPGGATNAAAVASFLATAAAPAAGEHAYTFVGMPV